MLKEAVKASLPIICAHTRDTVHLAETLFEATGVKPIFWDGKAPMKMGGFYVLVGEKASKGLEGGIDAAYGKMLALKATLLVVNPHKVLDQMFDAGELPMPRKGAIEFLKALTADEKKAEELLRSLGGCTLKELMELCQLTMVKEKSLTPGGIMRTRKSSFAGSKGLSVIDTEQVFYVPSPAIKAWVMKEKSYFLKGTDQRLIPRGLLFDGPPGVGKTAGAKYLAHEFAVPLYRFDVAGAQNKYIGESEANMLHNLARIDHEEPCIVLFDEVEKIFSTRVHTHQTQTGLLSQLLWWLAEHKSRVLTIMTTNNVSVLPPELHREGRIDQTISFEGLTFDKAINFVGQVMKGFSYYDPHQDTIYDIAKEAMGEHPLDTNPLTVSQAALTTAVYNHVKLQFPDGSPAAKVIPIPKTLMKFVPKLVKKE